MIKSIKLTNLLSYGPDSPDLELRPLNVLIGPNGSGKSNLIEAISLLRATPTGFAQPVKGIEGGGVKEWLWKGTQGATEATIEVSIATYSTTHWRTPRGIAGQGLLTARADSPSN